MSTSNEATKETAAETSLTKDVINAGRYYLWRATNWARQYLGGRRGLIVLAVAVLGVGAALNWGWLVAIGVAPILLALAPCAAMCALGLCMNRGGKSCSTQSSSADQNANLRSSSTALDPKSSNEPVVVSRAKPTRETRNSQPKGSRRAAPPGAKAARATPDLDGKTKPILARANDTALAPNIESEASAEITGRVTSPGKGAAMTTPAAELANDPASSEAAEAVVVDDATENNSERS